jgi:hypothetical protein
MNPLMPLLVLLFLQGGFERADAEPSSLQDRIPEVIVSSSTIGDVSFPHFLHVDDIGVECDECHHEIDAAALVTPHDGFFDDFWIQCQTCHRDGDVVKVAQSCSNCHNGRPVTIADQRLSAKVAIHTRCWSCHEVGTGVQATHACQSCHTRPTGK